MVISAELAKAAVTSGGVSQPSAIISAAPATAMVTGGKRSSANATNKATMTTSPNIGRCAAMSASRWVTGAASHRRTWRE